MEFTSIETPLILGSASLTAFISVRATSIADRIRAADKEICDPATVSERRQNLLGQVRGLKHRYEADTYATLALLVSFGSFVTMGALVANAHQSAVAAFAVGSVAGAIGFVLTLYEVYMSKNTLFSDIAYAEAVARDDAPTNKATIIR